MKRICPNEELLAGYLEDRLAIDERSNLESHFSDCARCRDEFLTASSLVQTRQYPDAGPVPQHVTAAAVKLAAQLVSRPRDAKKPAGYSFFQKLFERILEHIKLVIFNKNRFAPVRGSRSADNGDFYRVRKMFRDIVAEIEIEKAGRQIAAIRVTLVNGFGVDSDIRVTLHNDGGREIASFRITEKFVVFDNIPFGHYSLTFIQNGSKIGTYRFEIKESD